LNLDIFPGTGEKPNLKNPDYDQKETKKPRAPVVNSPPNSRIVSSDSDLRKRADRYSGFLLLFILTSYGVSMYFGGYGLYRALDCRNWWVGC
jgi:hypothetical protein